MAEHKSTGAREVFLRTIAIVGLIAVLVLGAWGIILLAFNLPSVFSNVGSSLRSAFVGTESAQTIQVTAPQSAKSGEAFQLSWVHDNRASGTYTYTISYACESGLSIKAPAANGTYQSVPCNTPFNSVAATENMRLIPTLTSGTSADAVITVTATDAEGAIAAFSSATVAVTRTASNSAPTKPTTATDNNTTYTYVPAATRVTQLYGYPDLLVRITSITPTQQYIGYTQGYTIPPYQQNRRYTMQFVIENVGTNMAQSGWNFNTLIPWMPQTYTFTSQAQQALYPGDKIVYTMNFEAMNDNQVCTMQYPNNCYPYQYQNPNYNYTYQSNCGYTYNGYTNIYRCGYTDSNGNWIDTGSTYNQYQYPYNQQYSYPYTNYRSVAVQVDPQNWVPENSEVNNRATVQLPW